MYVHVVTSTIGRTIYFKCMLELKTIIHQKGAECMDIEQLEALRARVLEQSAQGQKLIGILYDLADWTDRGTLAARMGKKRLNPHDAALLDRLAAAGLVEVAKRPYHGRHGYEYIYRLRGDVHRGLNALKAYRRQKA